MIAHELDFQNRVVSSQLTFSLQCLSGVGRAPFIEVCPDQSSLNHRVGRVDALHPVQETQILVDGFTLYQDQEKVCHGFLVTDLALTFELFNLSNMDLRERHKGIFSDHQLIVSIGHLPVVNLAFGQAKRRPGVMRVGKVFAGQLKLVQKFVPLVEECHLIGDRLVVGGPVKFGRVNSCVHVGRQEPLFLLEVRLAFPKTVEIVSTEGAFQQVGYLDFAMLGSSWIAVDPGSETWLGRHQLAVTHFGLSRTLQIGSVVVEEKGQAGLGLGTGFQFVLGSDEGQPVGRLPTLILRVWDLQISCDA